MITLVLGGVRSGKSELAEQLAGAGPVTYVATGVPTDEDFADRVARHRARRPQHWATIEESRAVPQVLARLHGPVLLDALGTWIANDPRADIPHLVRSLTTRHGDTVVVSEEVGLGVHAPTEVGRLFADRLGEANRQVAEVADRCLLVVAGRVIELPSDFAVTHGSDGQAEGAGPHAGADTDRQGGPRPHAVAGTAGQGGGRPGDREGAWPGDREAGRPGDREGAWPDPDRVRNGFRAAVAFLTPLGGAVTPGPRALSWFPVVGGLLGLALGAIWWGADHLVGPLVAAALVVVADLVLTGALHFDGLVDSADGLLPHLPPDRRLEVMAEPDAGAFGVAAGAGCLLLRTAALAELGGLTGLGQPRPLLLAGLWCTSRTSMAVAARLLPYARGEGLASSFGTGGNWMAVAAGGGALALALGLADDPATAAALVPAVAAAAAVHLLATRRLGGFTGDVLGAAGVVAETVGLLVAVGMGVAR